MPYQGNPTGEQVFALGFWNIELLNASFARPRDIVALIEDPWVGSPLDLTKSRVDESLMLF
jgi:hypothetical protein